MASRTALKSYFQTGDTPTESQFGELIDSFGDDERRVGTATALNATTLILDSAPLWAVRSGKVAIGVGLATCEIREFSAISGATLTLNFGMFNTHSADERVIFFDRSEVPLGWWGCKGSDTTFDNRAA